MKEIIENNFVIQRFFDHMPDGYSSNKYLSEEQAEIVLESKRSTQFYSYRIVEALAIIGIVKFNSTEAFVFNKPLTNGHQKGNCTTVTACDYESLMNCYVYSSECINLKQLNKLKAEYYARGGRFFNDYHGYEIEVLRPERKRRNRLFRNQIVEQIFRHGFRETGKNKWSNGFIEIKELNIQRSAINYPSYKSHSDLEIDINMKLYLGSIFSTYAVHFNQLSNNSFCVPCKKSDTQRYCFVPFEITFNN